MLEMTLIFAALGAVAGVAAGLLGIGGGVIIVPVLIYFSPYLAIDPTVTVHLAIGTSLATIVLTGLSSAWSHHRHGAVQWPVVVRLTIGIVIGAWLGAAFAAALPGELLKRVFGGLLLVLSVQMFTQWQPHGGGALPRSPLVLPTAGVGVGIVAALTGIGGGLLLVPLMRYWGIAMKQAVATSAGCGIPVALSGTIGFIATGWQHPQLPPWAMGFVYLPAFLGIATVSMLAAPLGARLAHQLPTRWLKRIFALLLAIVGLELSLS